MAKGRLNVSDRYFINNLLMDARVSTAQNSCHCNHGFANGVVALRRCGAYGLGRGFIHNVTWTGIASGSLRHRK